MVEWIADELGLTIDSVMYDVVVRKGGATLDRDTRRHFAARAAADGTVDIQDFVILTQDDGREAEAP